MADIFVIYGAQGVGKTSLISMCENPLLVDCEGSLERALGYTKEEVSLLNNVYNITTLKEFDTFLLDIESITKEYETIFIDTIAGLQSIIKTGLTMNKGGNMSMASWGQLSTKCNALISKCKQLACKRVVVLAHEADEKDQEGQKLFAILGDGGNFTQRLPGIAFGVARLRKESTGSFLDFNDPFGVHCKTPDALSKSSHIQIRSHAIGKVLKEGQLMPKILQTNVFDVIEQYKKDLSEKVKDANEIKTTYKRAIDLIASTKELNEYFINNLQTPEFQSYHARLRMIIEDAYKAKKLELEKKESSKPVEAKPVEAKPVEANTKVKNSNSLV